MDINEIIKLIYAIFSKNPAHLNEIFESSEREFKQFENEEIINDVTQNVPLPSRKEIKKSQISKKTITISKPKPDNKNISQLQEQPKPGNIPTVIPIAVKNNTNIAVLQLPKHSISPPLDTKTKETLFKKNIEIQSDLSELKKQYRIQSAQLKKKEEQYQTAITWFQNFKKEYAGVWNFLKRRKLKNPDYNFRLKKAENILTNIYAEISVACEHLLYLEKKLGISTTAQLIKARNNYEQANSLLQNFQNEYRGLAGFVKKMELGEAQYQEKLTNYQIDMLNTSAELSMAQAQLEHTEKELGISSQARTTKINNLKEKPKNSSSNVVAKMNNETAEQNLSAPKKELKDTQIQKKPIIIEEKSKDTTKKTLSTQNISSTELIKIKTLKPENSITNILGKISSDLVETAKNIGSELPDISADKDNSKQNNPNTYFGSKISLFHQLTIDRQNLTIATRAHNVAVYTLKNYEDKKNSIFEKMRRIFSPAKNLMYQTELKPYQDDVTNTKNILQNISKITEVREAEYLLQQAEQTSSNISSKL